MTKKVSSADAVVSAPSTPCSAFPIIGVGASAGGLAAFEAFFSGIPAQVPIGMAFVLVQHMAPDHKSMLSELLRRLTSMHVFDVLDNMVVEPNCVYIIPPSKDMTLSGGRLHLLEPSAPRGQRLTIDYFFRSLAHELQERAIGIVLSGTGSDGTLGVRAIKEAGGIVLVQTPESTEFDGMPRSALASGVVDFELPADKMAAVIIAYVERASGKPAATPNEHMQTHEAALRKVFLLLRTQTTHDFSLYKRNTIERRIERRMALLQITTIENYVSRLQDNPVEIQALFHDLLIGVTSFFRDPDAFKLLEDKVIPQLFANKSSVSGVVRVWVAGCSTGEEAYSLAILLQERVEKLHQPHTVQVFATDIDSRAIARARIGLYPVGIAADISATRLTRFFTTEPDGSGYRVHKHIRDMLVFSEQDLNKDPPFSKIDLIACRNLLIYLGGELQRRLIPMFHYALNPQGVLFLGSSEGVGDFRNLFSELDRKAKLYQRKPSLAAPFRSGSSSILSTLSGSKERASQVMARSSLPAALPLRELTEQALLAHVAPTGALVNARGDILYLHGRTGLYLEPAPGEVGDINIFKMAREGLRPALSHALKIAAATQNTVRSPGLRVKTNGHYSRVNLNVRPVATTTTAKRSEADAPPVETALLYLVILEEATEQLDAALPASHTDQATDLSPDALVIIAGLRDELRAKDEYLHSTHEELETANEELTSSLEEMQSVNEEMQSVNEEIETSKEELQSVNEELATVNNELAIKVDDLTRINDDMNNLLAGTGIATVFVDHQLRLLRFTPMAGKLINLIASDVGRPLGHFTSNLIGYSSLESDLQSVLDTLVPKSIEVHAAAGEWYTLRISPYRTTTNEIEGAVLTFSDISELKRSQSLLSEHAQLARLAVVVRDAGDAITVQDLQGHTLAWNPAAERMYGWTEAQALSINVRERIPLPLQDAALLRVQQLSKAEVLAPYLTKRLTKNGTAIDISMTATCLLNEAGEVYAIATNERAGSTLNLPMG